MEPPPLPQHSLILVDERDACTEPGFLRIRRVTLRARFEGGEESSPFVYDIIHRDRLDAVVIAAHFRDDAGRRHVFLRSALRPPVALRPLDVRPFPEKPWLGALWELPAGLVEVEEQSPEGLRSSAARELLEELGVEVDPAALRELGPSTFPAPGMVGERHYYFEVEVDPRARTTPTEDGSALEQGAVIFALPLDEAIACCRRGAIEDAKTELALRRLAER
jgi:ADP-ribose pyrophosphatase